MLLQSKQLYNKIKFVNDSRDLRSDREENKYVQMLLEDGKVYAKSFSGYSLYRVFICEDTENEIKNASFLFDTSKIVKSLAKVDAQVEVHFDWTELTVNIRNKSMRLKDKGMPDVGVMPEFPKDTDTWDELNIPEAFVDCLKRVSWLAEKDHSYPACRGVEVWYDESLDSVAYFCTNRLQLVLATEKDNIGSITSGGIIPIETVDMLLNVDLGISSKIHFDSEQLGFLSGEYGMVSTHINTQGFGARVHDVYGAVKAHESWKIIVDKQELWSSIKFSLQYCSNNYDQIRLSFTDSMITVAASSDEGSFFGEHDIKYTGDSLEGQEMVINHKYFLNCLRGIDAPSVEIEIYDDPSGIVMILRPNKNEIITTEILIKNPKPYI